MSNFIDIVPWLTDIAYSFGYPGIAALVALGYLHLPIPTELTLPLAGFLVGQGRFSFVPVLAAAATGAVTSSLVLYTVGLWIGEERLRKFVARCERFKLVYLEDLDKASKSFERHGGKAILIGHLVPGVGALISIPAGLKRMPIRWRFMGYTVLGGTLWNGTLLALGWALGRRWRMAELYASIIGYALLAVLFFAVLWLLWRRWRTPR